MAAVKCLLVTLALAALLFPASASPAGLSLGRKEALDRFFSSASARQRFAGAVRAAGVQLDRGMASLLTPPWARLEALRPLQANLNASQDEIIETVRRIIETVAEPLKIEMISLNYSDPLLRSVGSIRDVVIDHLSSFNVRSVNLDLFNVAGNLKIDFDTVDAHGYYDMDITASGQLHVFGNGHFDIRLTRPSLDIDAQLGYEDEHFTVDHLKLSFGLEKLKVVMTDLLGGGDVGDLICGIISDVGPAALDMYQDQVSTVLSAEAKDTANALLTKLDIDTIIDWITGGGDDNEN